MITTTELEDPLTDMDVHKLFRMLIGYVEDIYRRMDALEDEIEYARDKVELMLDVIENEVKA